jgi:hypothetical protein
MMFLGHRTAKGFHPRAAQARDRKTRNEVIFSGHSLYNHTPVMVQIVITIPVVQIAASFRGFFKGKSSQSNAYRV